VGRQLLRSGTGVGANYREGLRARSKSEYAAKLSIALMELEETLYWLELVERASYHGCEEARKPERRNLGAECHSSDFYQAGPRPRRHLTTVLNSDF